MEGMSENCKISFRPKPILELTDMLGVAIMTFINLNNLRGRVTLKSEFPIGGTAHECLGT